MAFNTKEDTANTEFVCVGAVLIGSRTFWAFMSVHTVFMKMLARHPVVFHNTYNCIYIDSIYRQKLRLHSKFSLLSDNHSIFDDQIYFKHFFSICIRKWKVKNWFLSGHFTSWYHWIITWFIKLNSNKTNQKTNPRY